MTKPRDVIADLIRAAGRRPEPPAADRDTVLLAARTAWQKAVRQRKRRHFIWGLAASAALVTVALSLFGRRASEPDLTARFGAVDSLQGELAVRTAESATWRPLRSGEMLSAGAQVRALRTAAAFVVAGSGSIRLRPESQLALLGSARMRLDSGTVYVDVEPVSDSSAKFGARGRGMVIETPFGVVRDIGTTFELAADANTLRLRVRDGRVAFARSAGAAVVEAAAGDELLLTDDGALRRGTVDVSGANWRWAEQIAKPFNPEGRRLVEFLRWVARETGRKLRFRSAQDELMVNNAVLHGSTRNLAPMEALDLMLSATDFEYSLTPDSVLVVGRRAAVN